MTLDRTKIEWTDFTVNFWEGCQKVGPGCDHCYAEARDARFHGGAHWGPGAPRRKVKGGIPKLRKINRDAEAFHATHGHWPRVFCSSLSDIFDNAVDPAWRIEAFTEIDRAGDTRVQLLTKRVGNVEKMVPDMWRDGGWPQHVGLMITVVNQAEADRDILKLLDIKAQMGIPWVGLSMEPLLGPVDLRLPYAGAKVNVLAGAMPAVQPVDWIIVGGESGRGARPMHPDWARALRDQCQGAGVPFFFKQAGEWTAWEFYHPPYLRNAYTSFEVDKYAWLPANMDDDPDWDAGLVESIGLTQAVFQRAGKRAAGRSLDGREWKEFPDGCL